MKKTYEKYLFLIFLWALVLRIGFILTLNNNVDVWGDWWDELGWKIASGQGYWVNNPYFPDGPRFYAWRSPGFPLFLAIIYKIFGHNYFAAKIGLAILSSLTCILIYFLGITLIDKRTGLLSALLFSIYPPSIFWTGYLAPVTLEIFLMCGFTFFLMLGEKNSNIFYYFISGIFLGFGILTRSLFLILLIFLFIYFILFYREKFLKNYLLITIPCLLVISPWGIRNYKIFKKFLITSTEGGIVCYIANNSNSLNEPSGYWNPPLEYFKKFEGLSEIEINNALYKEAKNFILNNPKTYLKLIFDRFKRYWRLYPHTFSGPGENYKTYHVIIGFLTYTPLIFFGFAGLLKNIKIWRKFLFIYFLIIGWSLPIILFFKTVIRYREPLSPFLIIFSVLFFKKNVEK
ncbi:MAG: glycosyltransferase family 39 protein [Candidatus Omnitrophica bacterium]|nr:glycosyltransferase family 39 protein [Candidatus Omnitrophota bacterium]MCM8806510.1 glycosyltransferase family 39 protein [Candidatus Omnitrophota bacterium]